MKLRPVLFSILAASCSAFAQAPQPPQQPAGDSSDAPVIFRSDVSLVRVDVQVLDGSNRAVTGLRASDFVLREQGKVREIRNFASEDMAMDVLLLLDVSGSMRSHVERIASAAHQAFQSLGRDDRVALMVFDRAARIRMPFRANRSGEVVNALDRLLNDERFNGGTDVTAGIYSAIDYVRKNSRRDARRAIVIMTDDETEFQSDVQGLVRSLHRDDIVLSLLLAPDAMMGAGRGGRGGGMGYPRRGGGSTWPRGGGGGGGMGGGWPPIIFGPGGGGGRRMPGGGGGGGGPVVLGGRGTHTAGTDQVAEQSGGDHMSVDQASALEDTLTRLRQRYALHFNLPEGVRAGQERNLQIDLSSATRRRYPDAELRYRHTYNAQDSNTSTPAEVTTTTPADDTRGGGSSSDDRQQQPRQSTRRPRVSDPGSGANTGPIMDRPATASDSDAAPTTPQQPPAGGWPKAGTTTQTPAPAATPAPAQDKPASTTKTGGWPRAKQ